VRGRTPGLFAVSAAPLGSNRFGGRIRGMAMKPAGQHDIAWQPRRLARQINEHGLGHVLGQVKEWPVASERFGVAIISETAGVASELGASALLVSPLDIEGTAHAMAWALDMPGSERRARLAHLRSRVQLWTAAHWLCAQLQELQLSLAAANAPHEQTFRELVFKRRWAARISPGSGFANCNVQGKPAPRLDYRPFLPVSPLAVIGARGTGYSNL